MPFESVASVRPLLRSFVGSVVAALALASCLPAAAAAAQSSDSGKERALRIVEYAISDRIEPDGSLERRQRQVVEVLTPAGVAQYSQVGVPFLEANQEARLELLEVRKRDGRVLDLAATAPTDVSPVYPLNLPIYSDLRVLRAAVPSLEAGDTIEFVTVVRVKPLVENEAWTEFKFSTGEIVLAQRYELDLPAELRMTVHVRPDLEAKLEEERRDGRWIRRWSVESAPPSAPDTATEPETAEGETRSKGNLTEAEEAAQATPDVQATSFASWGEFGRWWASLAPPKVDDAIRAKAEELTRGKSTPSERLAAIHRYVAQEIRYLSLPLGIGAFKAREPSQVLQTGLGDCKDKTRLLASLARSVGIEVEPVLLAAGTKRALVEEVPSPMQFDHVVGRARLGPDPAKDVVWMDPTSEMTPLGRLPPGARDRRGVVLREDEKATPASVRAEIVATPEGKFRLDTRSETVGSVDANGLIQAKVRWTFEGDAEILRLAGKYGDEASRRRSVEALRVEWDDDDSTITDWASSPPADVDYPFWVEYDVEWPMSASVWKKAWTFWIPVPRVEIAAPPEPDDEEGAALDRVDFDEQRHQIRSARIELPEGVRVAPPVPISVQRDFAEFRSSYRVEGRALIIERELTVRVDSVPRARFGELRAFRELIRKDRNQEFDVAAAPEIVPELPPPAEDADDLYASCMTALDDERHLEAESLCRRATVLEPNHPSAWNSLGNALTELGRWKDAEAAYRRQIEIDPSDEHAYNGLGRVRWHEGDLGGAEKLFRQQIDIAPLVSYGHSNLGALLVQRGRAEEGAISLRRALKLDPDDEWTLNALFEAEAKLGRLDALATLGAEHPDLPRKPDQRLRIAHLALENGKGSWAPLEPWLRTLRAEAERTLETYDAPRPDAAAMVAVWSLALAWEAEARAGMDQGRLADAVPLLESAKALGATSSAATALAAARKAGGGVAADAAAGERLGSSGLLTPEDPGRCRKPGRALVDLRRGRNSLAGDARRGRRTEGAGGEPSEVSFDDSRAAGQPRAAAAEAPRPLLRRGRVQSHLSSVPIRPGRSWPTDRSPATRAGSAVNR